MYEKIIIIICRTVFIITILAIPFICSGCRTNKVLSDNESGTIEYREIESEIRDGETELAITSERISNNSSEIKESSEQLGNQLNKLEQSIRESKSNEQELGTIIQQIRTREIPGNKLVELGIIPKE